MKFLLIIFLIPFSLISPAQEGPNTYLNTHHYSFSVDTGFDRLTSEVLKQKLSQYKLVILGEAGSHYLQFYEPLRFTLIKFLNSSFGLTHFFMEYGHSSQIICNQYLQTDDTSYLPKARFTKNKIFWRNLFSYNLLQNKKIKSFGIDFERTHSYCKALKFLLPNIRPSEKIESVIELIKTSNDTLNDCDYIISLNSKIENALKDNIEEFKIFFAKNFIDFQSIVENNGTCKDASKNRNQNMAINFLSFDKKFNDKIYYGQLGMAHTIFSTKNTASYINSSPAFKNKVCIINTYCYNCTTIEESVSNWPLHKIEKDILQQLLKYCITDFTLFDFSENNEAVNKFRTYGQFLIVAKNQN